MAEDDRITEEIKITSEKKGMTAKDVARLADDLMMNLPLKEYDRLKKEYNFQGGETFLYLLLNKIKEI